MSAFLFDEFQSVSSKQWKQKIQTDLKGADYNDTLVWQSAEGIDVKPFYHRDQLEKPVTAIPGHPPEWTIGQAIFVDDTGIANRLATDALQRGAESVFFTAEKTFDSNQLLKPLLPESRYLYVDLKFLDPDFCKEPVFTQKKVFLLTDIIHHHAKEGNWHSNLETDFKTLQEIVAQTNTIAVDSTLYQNAGATHVQQLAYALAHSNEYLNKLGHSLNTNSNIVFKVAVGGNYFFEIAKIRALRLLYATLAAEYGVNIHCHIIAMPSKRNKTLYDYNVNMLRTTTECMSAALGGADTVCNLPYDALYHKSNEFGERISRNQLLVLKNESYLNDVSNPADGSYYIENLTTQLAEKALKLVKDIEKGGGFLSQLKEGTIQQKIKESAEKEQQAFNKGEKILLGTNKHPNPEDHMKNDLELFPFVKIKPRKTHIEPIIERRLAEVIEQERLDNE